MRRIGLAVMLTALVAGSVIAGESWQPKSWNVGNGTVRTVLAGWSLIHFPDTDAQMLMVGREDKPLVAITDYPDSVEIRAVVPGKADLDFMTLRDRDHDGRYEEVDGLPNGTLLKLKGGDYRLVQSDGGWSLVAVETPEAEG